MVKLLHNRISEESRVKIGDMSTQESGLLGQARKMLKILGNTWKILKDLSSK